MPANLAKCRPPAAYVTKVTAPAAAAPVTESEYGGDISPIWNDQVVAEQRRKPNPGLPWLEGLSSKSLRGVDVEH